MRIVLGFVIVALLGGVLAWLVSTRSASRPGVATARRPDLTPPDVPLTDILSGTADKVAEQVPVSDGEAAGFEAGFLDSHFGDEVAEPVPWSGPAAALDGGESPGPTYVIKGNASSKIFHVPGSASYARTRAEIWFETEEQAVEAGYRAPKGRAPKAQ